MGLSYNVISISKYCSEQDPEKPSNICKCTRVGAGPRGQPAPPQHRPEGSRHDTERRWKGCQGPIPPVLPPERCAIGKHLKYVLHTFVLANPASRAAAEPRSQLSV